MKTDAPDPLLSAVFDEDAAFRRTTLAQTIALARRRRRVRLAGRVVGAAAVFAIAAWFLRPATPVVAPPRVTATPSLRIIHSTPLAGAESVRRQSAFFATVTSTPTTLALVASEPSRVLHITTRTGAPMLDYLDDRQLLAAFPGEHPALIAPGTTEARLVFIK